MRITIRLSREDGQKLDAIADQYGMTISDLVRELIRNGYERHTSSVTLEEIKAAINSMAAQKGGNSSSEDLAEIRRIVTLIAMAMPSVARQLS